LFHKVGVFLGALLVRRQDQELIPESRPHESLVQFFHRSPLLGVDLDLTRDRDPEPKRDIVL